MPTEDVANRKEIFYYRESFLKQIVSSADKFIDLDDEAITNYLDKLVDRTGL